MVIYELREHNYYRDETITNLYKHKKDAESALSSRKAMYLAQDAEMVAFIDRDARCTLGWKDLPTEYNTYTRMEIIERPLL